MNNHSELEALVADYMLANRLFTSVDIGNDIKKSGVVIRNRDVSDFLKKNWKNISDTCGCSYKTEIILTLKQKEAILYLPTNEFCSNYITRDLEATPINDVSSDIMEK